VRAVKSKLTRSQNPSSLEIVNRKNSLDLSESRPGTKTATRLKALKLYSKHRRIQIYHISCWYKMACRRNKFDCATSFVPASIFPFTARCRRVVKPGIPTSAMPATVRVRPPMPAVDKPACLGARLCDRQRIKSTLASAQCARSPHRTLVLSATPFRLRCTVQTQSPARANSHR
jgi:hypothetical protein